MQQSSFAEMPMTPKPPAKRSVPVPYQQIVWVAKAPYYDAIPTVTKMAGNQEVPGVITVTHDFSKTGKHRKLFTKERYEIGKTAFHSEAVAHAVAVQMLKDRIKKAKQSVKKMESRLKVMELNTPRESEEEH